MDIAAMNVRITFQQNAVVTDAIGNHKNVWKDWYSCFAAISDSSGKSNTEENAAGLIVDNSDVSFTVRRCRRAACVDTTGFRILWEGNPYNILRIDHLGMKKHALKFKCEKVRR